MITTPGAPATPGGRPPDRVPTPQCLFRTDINTGTAVAPADSVGGSIQDQIFSVLCSAPLKSVEFEEALDRLFTYDSVTPAALTPMAPSPAGCKSGGLGAQDATAYDRGTECLPAPSPVPQRDVLSAQVPPYSTTDHPVDQVRVQEVVKIETLPGGPTMLQGPSRGLCPAQTSGSPMTLKSASAGSARDVAPALGAPQNAISIPYPKQTQHGNDHLVVVKVQDAVSDIVTTGTAQCPFPAYSNPKTTPPAADLGGGDPIDVGRPPGHASTHDLSESAISELLARPNSAGLDREMERERERERERSILNRVNNK